MLIVDSFPGVNRNTIIQTLEIISVANNFQLCDDIMHYIAKYVSIIEGGEPNANWMQRIKNEV